MAVFKEVLYELKVCQPSMLAAEKKSFKMTWQERMSESGCTQPKLYSQGFPEADLKGLVTKQWNKVKEDMVLARRTFP